MPSAGPNGTFGSVSFGNVAQPGLAEDFLLADLTVVGSLQGGGGLGDVDLVYAPELRNSCFLRLLSHCSHFRADLFERGNRMGGHIAHPARMFGETDLIRSFRSRVRENIVQSRQ